MAEFDEHDPARPAEVADLARALLRATDDHRDLHEVERHLLRAEIRSESISLAGQARTELAQLRQELGQRLDLAGQQLETLLGTQTRALAVLLGAQCLGLGLLGVALRFWPR